MNAAFARAPQSQNRQTSEFSLAEREVLKQLRNGLIARIEAKRVLAQSDLTPIARCSAVTKHDAAVKRIVRARADLDALLLTDEVA